MFDDKEFMLNPKRWPNDVLPIKIPPKKQGEWPTLGFVMLDVATHPVVYIGNVFGVDASNFDQCEKREYESVDAILAAGWIVD